MSLIRSWEKVIWCPVRHLRPCGCGYIQPTMYFPAKLWHPTKHDPLAGYELSTRLLVGWGIFIWILSKNICIIRKFVRCNSFSIINIEDMKRSSSLSASNKLLVYIFQYFPFFLFLVGTYMTRPTLKMTNIYLTLK